MSKSLGNVVDPTDVILGSQSEPKRTAYGADCLRLWVAGHATNNTHITVGESVLTSTAERLHKIRNTCRFLLGVLSRHDAARPVPPEQMEWVDRNMLHRLAEYTDQCAEAYDKYQFNRVLALLTALVTNEISGLYIHMTRHRLYCGDLSSVAGRSALTTMHHVLSVVRQTMAPILPHLAEELVLHGHDGELVTPAVGLRDLLHRMVPASNLLTFDATLWVEGAEDEWKRAITTLQSEPGPCADSALAEILPVSRVTVRHGARPTSEPDAVATDRLHGVTVSVSPARGLRCDRCFRYTAQAQGEICDSCKSVVGS
ncbi:Isoleucine--tRNA ligase, mitochondrial [Amphibalanus amphitrite]|uniref:Isoleucine--tRNA ligase, mitochondrial n=1 Tax=Amphibalanus amphitrite TaxID=1232801 RepID=A0A6A4WSY5_AMPAM|nr:Isoleucine--tRNA ligase, mitochondrial [Amphibalanus amphitrite]